MPRKKVKPVSGTCRTAGVAVGLWIDDPPMHVAKRSYFDKLRAHGVTVIAVMLDTSRKGWDPKYTPARLDKLAKLCAEYGIELVLTTWPDPVKREIAKAARDMRVFIDATGATGWEIDTEFNWKGSRVQGFRRQGGRSAIDLAGDALVDSMLAVKAATGCRLELTTFTSHTENGRAADVAPYMDRLIPQAYSVRHRNRRNPKTRKREKWNVPYTHVYGPGKMQDHTLGRTLVVPGVEAGKIEMAAGLAAYDQRFPGKTIADAMSDAYDAAAGHGVREVRYWSSKWVVGIKSKSRSQREVARFVRSLAA